MPLHTLRADIDYGVARANTTYGVIGVKVWIYKGEVLKGEVGVNKRTITQHNDRPKRKFSDNRGGRDNRGGYNRDNNRSGGGSYGNRGEGGGYNRDYRPRPQGQGDRPHFNPNAGNISRPNALASRNASGNTPGNALGNTSGNTSGNASGNTPGSPVQNNRVNTPVQDSRANPPVSTPPNVRANTENPVPPTPDTKGGNE
jgi:hypothetical protein